MDESVRDREEGSRPGKLRGLAATSSDRHTFAILALDHVTSMAAVAQPGSATAIGRPQLAALKAAILDRLASAATAVLVDPEIGLRVLEERRLQLASVGIVLGIENGDYDSDVLGPRLLEGWSVARAVRTPVDALKISVLFDPRAGAIDAAERFVADVAAECRQADVALFVEPLVAPDSTCDRRSAVVECARRFGSLGADVLKLEFPIDTRHIGDERIWRDACAEVDAASPVPWTLLSGGETFARFRRMVEIACEAGASGFVAGRSVWRQAVQHPDDGAPWADAEQRLRELASLARATARPWSEHRCFAGHHAGGGRP
jgi:tagatose 1,6-diphosphate aldolase